MDTGTDDEVDRRGHHQEDHIEATGFVVKIERKDEQIPSAHLEVFHHQGVEKHHYGEETQEEAAVEKQGIIRRIEQSLQELRHCQLPPTRF